MYKKRVLFTIALSILIMLLLMFLLYDFDMSWMNISNVFFFMGAFYFFPGLIIVTGSTEVFAGMGYLTRRIFLKDKGEGNYFKSFNDYKEYKYLKNGKYNTKSKGVNILLVGGVYIIISIVISMVI